MTSVSAINEWMKRLCYLHLKAVFILSTVTLIYVNSCALHLYQAIPSLYAREYFLCVDFNVILALASRSVIYLVQIVCAHRFSSLFPGEPGSWVDARWTFFSFIAVVCLTVFWSKVLRAQIHFLTPTRPSKGFPLLSALRVASPDTIGPNIVECGSQKMKNPFPVQSWVNYYSAFGWCCMVFY